MHSRNFLCMVMVCLYVLHTGDANRDRELRKLSKKIQVLESLQKRTTGELEHKLLTQSIELDDQKYRLADLELKLNSSIAGARVTKDNIPHGDITKYEDKITDLTLQLDNLDKKLQRETSQRVLLESDLQTVKEKLDRFEKHFSAEADTDKVDTVETVSNIKETTDMLRHEVSEIEQSIGKMNNSINSARSHLQSLSRAFKVEKMSLRKLSRSVEQNLTFSIQSISNSFSETLNSIEANIRKEILAGDITTRDETTPLLPVAMTTNTQSPPHTTQSPGDIKDCSDIKPTLQESGVFTIYPYEQTKQGKPVYCDVDQEGVWTVIQRRFDGSVNFTRNWREYKTGFGDANGEYWIGNDVLHQLTVQGQYELKIILKDWENVTKYFLYTTFIVADEAEQYKLGIGGYSGDTRDGMAVHNGMKFSTFDRDNDRYRGSEGYMHCAMYCKGGWWYRSCHRANLNGHYLHSNPAQTFDVVSWFYWHGDKYSLKETTMMIKRK